MLRIRSMTYRLAEVSNSILRIVVNIGDSRAGVLHEDLRTACLGALELNREDAVARARLFSWRAATEQFFAHLHPRQRGAGVPAMA